jgi:Flp pilus assembly pilin Flp
MVDRFNALYARVYLMAQSGLRRQEGQTMAEYALILGIIVAVGVTLFTTMGTQIHSKFQQICTTLGGTTGAGGSCP